MFAFAIPGIPELIIIGVIVLVGTAIIVAVVIGRRS